jgi:hypothetical protein
MVKILTNETPVEQLQRDFTEELKDMMKQAAKRLGCPVEHLKYRVDNVGVVEIEQMDSQEAEDMRREEIVRAKQVAILKERGRFNV